MTFPHRFTVTGVSALAGLTFAILSMFIKNQVKALRAGRPGAALLPSARAAPSAHSWAGLISQDV
ncbi:hypothetical protein CE91St41_36880 [Oscillospiraceae bacterium]|nr:hypothetical protein CE91St40_36860 [Oscillospiraceae bacterium]BDF76799.1 hypothetical protein CE91St41_36880 [Oscillospiraceae bacterium]